MRLKALMEERDLTQQQVAEAAGVSRAAVSKWLQGTIPGARELFRLAKFLDKPMESFFDAIPHVKPTTEALYVDPPGGVSMSHLSADWRKFYAGMFEKMSTPEGVEAFRQTFEKLFPASRTPQSAPVEKSKQVLTVSSDSVTYAPMKSELEELLSVARRLTKLRGMKTKLAKALHVPLPRVSDWLAGNYLPSGQRALELREWVRAQEGQQKKSPESASTLSGRKTQSKASNEKKPRSNPPTA